MSTVFDMYKSIIHDNFCFYLDNSTNIVGRLKTFTDGSEGGLKGNDSNGKSAFYQLLEY